MDGIREDSKFNWAIAYSYEGCCPDVIFLTEIEKKEWIYRFRSTGELIDTIQCQPQLKIPQKCRFKIPHY